MNHTSKHKGKSIKREKTVLITGASYGIGEVLAVEFIRDGYDLVLTARSEDKLTEVRAELLKKHPQRKIHLFPMDLSLPNAPAMLVKQLDNQNITVDVLVNNAGYGLLEKFHETDINRILNMISLNVDNLVHLTALLTPAMIAQKSGGILNVASIAAYVPGPNMAVYYATKAFVLSFSEALHEELKAYGIGVTCLAPGPTKTRFGEVSGMESSLIFQMGAQNADEVAHKAYQGFKKGKTVVVPGFRNKLTILFSRIIPRALVRKVVYKIQKIR
ncbi:MAG: SDR family oxidoreductase [Candidatus Marinimicrobia bacterium]|nr:SDR family oxidoreductase [Candidatus Neomarinimicrobiota bacterium]